MKHSNYINQLLKFGALALATGWVQTLGAFTYSETDLLLVFRKDNFNDVEFNLGSVSNYLGKTDGTVITVSNWDLAQVRANYNNSLANVKFLLTAVTASSNAVPRVWLTDANSAGTPTDISGSKFSGLYSKISFIGGQAQSFTITNSQEIYIVPPSDVSSYTYIVSQPGQLDPGTMGGSAPFPVESENPATNRFVQLKVSNATTKPAATIVGVFSLTAAGVLTFTAGPPQAALPPSQIQSIARTGSQNTITFSTVAEANYRLRYTTTLGPGISGWTVLATTIAGDGTNKALTDTATDAQRFYGVDAFR